MLSAKEVADLHVQAAVVDCLDDFYSHSWRTSRFDKWATLMLYLNTPAGIAAMVGMAVLWCVLENASVVPALLVNHYDGFFGAADEAADGWVAAEGAMDGSGAASAAKEWGDNQRGAAPAVTPPGRWAPTLG